MMYHQYKDLSIYYEIHGSGTPMLLLHGWGCDHRMMEACMEPIFRRNELKYQRIYIDLPGMGRTEGCPWINGSDRMLEVLMNFIGTIIPDTHFVLAGQSYGGYLARGLVYHMPDRINGLLLICPAFRPWIKTESGFDKGDVPGHSVLEKEKDLTCGMTEEDKDYFESITVLQNHRVLDRFCKEILPGLKQGDKFFLENYLSQNAHFSFPVNTLPKPFEQPVLILTGRQDSATGYRDQFKLLDDYPHGSFVVLDRAGHNLPIEQDRLFELIVSEWLGRVVAKQGRVYPGGG